MYTLVDVDSFKPRCSSLESIMGRIGLTGKQSMRYSELLLRREKGVKPLTLNMTEELEKLEQLHLNPELPEGCKTYLKNWYAEQLYGKSEQLENKYTKKGNYCEEEAIRVIEDKFAGFGERFEKNTERRDNGWIEGEPDVVADIIYDAKCSWDGKTFLDSVTGPHNTLYVWQMRGYCWLFEKPEAKVCYVLLDTPEDVNFGIEVSYSDIQIGDRFYYFTVKRDKAIETEIIERVKLCRKWLREYDKTVVEALTK